MRVSLSLFLTMLTLLLTQCSPYQWQGSLYQPADQAPPISLETTQGDPFVLTEYRGEVVLLFFGYTFCPDVCPSTLADLTWVMSQLGNAAADTHVVFITVDPERDTPEALRTYLDRFDEDFIGLVGTPQEIESAKGAYGVFAEKDPGEMEAYTVSHTARVFLIDPGGNLRLNYSFDLPREALLSDIRHLLEER